MKNYYVKILSIVLIAFSVKAEAQCSSCTTTISGTDAANHIVNSGTTLCITSTGTCTGLITVAAGGALCNQGNINSTNLWVAGGTLTNFGSISTSRIYVSGQGGFTNYGLVTMDSLGVANASSSMINNGTINGTRLGNADFANIVNNGHITVDYMADSSATFTNNLSGSFIVNFDFANAYNSSYFNHGYYKVSRDFYNSTGATFEASCMGIVGRDWYNSAVITGPASGCGGFNITSGSYNSGTIGSSSTHVDICDAGHPVTGLDGPGGTIASTTTYCTCSNACVQPTIGIAEHESNDIVISALFPNPAVNTVSFEMNNKNAGMLTVDVYDMMGKKRSSSVIKANSGENKESVDVSALAQGTYILSVTDAKQQQSKNMFSVVK